MPLSTRLSLSLPKKTTTLILVRLRVQRMKIRNRAKRVWGFLLRRRCLTVSRKLLMRVRNQIVVWRLKRRRLESKKLLKLVRIWRRSTLTRKFIAIVKKLNVLNCTVTASDSIKPAMGVTVRVATTSKVLRRRGIMLSWHWWIEILTHLVRRLKMTNMSRAATAKNQIALKNIVSAIRLALNAVKTANARIAKTCPRPRNQVKVHLLVSSMPKMQWQRIRQRRREKWWRYEKDDLNYIYF